MKIFCDEICRSHTDNSENIFKCPELGNTSDIQYSDLFSKDMNKISKSIKIFKTLWKTREDKLKQMKQTIPTR